MTTIIVGLLIVCFLLAYWKKFNNANSQLRFEAELFRLRDELRWLAIEGKIKSDNPVFELYDKAFSYSIRDSYFFTIFFLSLIRSQSEVNSKEFKDFKRKVKFLSSSFPELEEIKDEYDIVLRNYLLQQHRVSFRIISTCLYPMSFFKRESNKVRENISQSFFLMSKSADDKFNLISG